MQIGFQHDYRRSELKAVIAEYTSKRVCWRRRSARLIGAVANQVPAAVSKGSRHLISAQVKRGLETTYRRVEKQLSQENLQVGRRPGTVA